MTLGNLKTGMCFLGLCRHVVEPYVVHATYNRFGLEGKQMRFRYVVSQAQPEQTSLLIRKVSCLCDTSLSVCIVAGQQGHQNVHTGTAYKGMFVVQAGNQTGGLWTQTTLSPLTASS